MASPELTLLSMLQGLTPDELALLEARIQPDAARVAARNQFDMSPPQDLANVEDPRLNQITAQDSTAEPLYGINTTTAPYSPEERARRAQLDALTEVASRVAAANGPNLLSRPKAPDSEKNALRAAYAATQFGNLMNRQDAIAAGRQSALDQARASVLAAHERWSGASGGDTNTTRSIADAAASLRAGRPLTPQQKVALFDSRSPAAAQLIKMSNDIEKRWSSVVTRSIKGLFGGTSLVNGARVRADGTPITPDMMAYIERVRGAMAGGDWYGVVQGLRALGLNGTANMLEGKLGSQAAPDASVNPLADPNS